MLLKLLKFVGDFWNQNHENGWVGGWRMKSGLKTAYSNTAYSNTKVYLCSSVANESGKSIWSLHDLPLLHIISRPKEIFLADIKKLSVFLVVFNLLLILDKFSVIFHPKTRKSVWKTVFKATLYSGSTCKHWSTP